MKVLMFAPIFPPQIGGPATQSYNLCRVLFSRDHLPIVLTPGKRFERACPEGYPVYRYPWRFTGIRLLDKILRWTVFPFVFLHVLYRERPHILHAHSVSAASFIAGALAGLHGIPSIIKFAGDWAWETLSTSKLRGKDFHDVYQNSWKGRFLKSVERLGVSLFTVVWVPSEFRRQNVINLLGSDRKVRKIPNALLLTHGGVREFGNTDPVIIVSANRFIPHKRVSAIVKAFQTIARPDVHLVLIGGGEEREVHAVEETIKRSPKGDRITLTGILSSEEVYAHFASASFYVSASLEEGFPNVFIEAMRYGLPIITTDVGGCREMVKDGDNGFLVDPHNLAELGVRMQELAVDVTLRNRMAHRAYEESKQYDLQQVIEQFIDLYRELLAKKHV